MSNLAKLEIVALDITGKNYMTWAVGAKTHLRGNGLLDAIDKSKTTSDEKKAKAMIFLRHHIHDSLKDEYIIKEDPADLWQSLKERFDHQKYVILPKAKHEWLHLRFKNYKSVNDYNYVMFGITSKMVLCGESISDYDMIEKTLSTFHPSNVVLQRQYRTNRYARYSELMHVLLVAEQNNKLVMMNHQSRPTGSAPFPEANVAPSSYNNWQGRGRGCGRYRGRGYGRGRGQEQGYYPYDFNRKRENKNFQERDDGREFKRKKEIVCYRCGLKNHWARTCRTPKHLADLYRESQKAKEKGNETNFISDEPELSFHGLNNDTHLDVSDFLVDPS